MNWRPSRSARRVWRPVRLRDPGHRLFGANCAVLLGHNLGLHSSEVSYDSNQFCAVDRFGRAHHEHIVPCVGCEAQAVMGWQRRRSLSFRLSSSSKTTP